MGSEEKWKDITGCDGVYQVSTEGRVRKVIGKDKTYMLEQYQSDEGYLWVNLIRHGVAEAAWVHVLVAEAFLPRPWLN